MRRPRRDQPRAMPQQWAPETSLRIRATRGVPSAPPGERLEPCGIVPVRLASRHGLDLPRRDERGRDPLLCKPREARPPLDPGRFHGDGVKVAGPQPVPQGVQSGGAGLPDAHGLGVALRWHGHNHRACAERPPGGMGMALGSVVPTARLGGGLGTWPGLPSRAGICAPAQSPAVRRVLSGGVGPQVPKPPVQQSHVMGHHGGARARSGQGLGGSSLLVAGDQARRREERAPVPRLLWQGVIGHDHALLEPTRYPRSSGSA